MRPQTWESEPRSARQGGEGGRGRPSLAGAVLGCGERPAPGRCQHSRTPEAAWGLYSLFQTQVPDPVATSASCVVSVPLL